MGLKLWAVFSSLASVLMGSQKRKVLLGITTQNYHSAFMAIMKVAEMAWTEKPLK